MSARKSLAGLTVLVLEDDYYVADDTRIALEAAGASVLGPCAAATRALALAERTPPDCALVDINLGDGADFSAAKHLLELGVPVVFMTGYGADVIPAALSDLPCLQKPAAAQKIVDAAASACGR